MPGGKILIDLGGRIAAIDSVTGGLKVDVVGGTVTQVANGGGSIVINADGSITIVEPDGAAGVSGKGATWATGSGGSGNTSGGSIAVTLGAGAGTGAPGQVTIGETATDVTTGGGNDYAALSVSKTWQPGSIIANGNSRQAILATLTSQGTQTNLGNANSTAAGIFIHHYAITGNTAPNPAPEPIGIISAIYLDSVDPGNTVDTIVPAVFGAFRITGSVKTTGGVVFYANIGPVISAGNILVGFITEDFDFTGVANNTIQQSFEGFHSSVTKLSPTLTPTDAVGGHFIYSARLVVGSSGNNSAGTNDNWGVFVNVQLTNAGGGTPLAGGTVRNVSAYLEMPSASGSSGGGGGGTLYNMGVWITEPTVGVANLSTLYRWAIFSASSAPSQLNGRLELGVTTLPTNGETAAPQAKLFVIASASVSADTTWDGVIVHTSTLTVTHDQTLSRLVYIRAPVISGAQTTTFASTVEIEGPPTVAAGGTLTAVSPLRIVGGTPVFEVGLTIGQATPSANATLVVIGNSEITTGLGLGASPTASQLKLANTWQIKANSGVISFSVVSTSLTQGSAGSLIIPVAAMSTAANDAARDVLAGNVDGAMAIDSVAQGLYWRQGGAWFHVAHA